MVNLDIISGAMLAATPIASTRKAVFILVEGSISGGKQILKMLYSSFEDCMYDAV